MHLESGCVGSFWWPEEYPRELALLDGVTHSARSPVCLIKHHAGCRGACSSFTRTSGLLALLVVVEQHAALSSQPTGKSSEALRRDAQRPARLVLVETNSLVIQI